MGRAETAYLLILVLAAAVFAVTYLTRRYQRYTRSVMRGHRPDKRVWKPFWLV